MSNNTNTNSGQDSSKSQAKSSTQAAQQAAPAAQEFYCKTIWVCPFCKGRRPYDIPENLQRHLYRFHNEEWADTDPYKQYKDVPIKK
ncbi:hypothetical protein IFR05_010858 [Cadophora sp. M221]|nr:hypothetical protein IFR05_010858 [Cadophora sp. M221]